MPKKGGALKKPFKPSTQTVHAIQTLQALVEDEAAWTKEENEQLERVFRCLKRVEELQSGHFISVIPKRTQASLDDLLQWAQKHGMDLERSGLRVDFVHHHGDKEDNNKSSDDATLFATRAIPKGDVLLTVPPSAILSSAPTSRRPSLAALSCATPAIGRSPSLSLTLVLLTEAADQSSPFGPYIRALPTNFTTPFASFENANHYSALHPSPAARLAIRTFRAQLRDYAGVFRAIASMRPSDLPLRFLSLANFRWAVSVVMTRQNSLPALDPSPSAVPVMGLVPLWDFFNHAPGDMSTAVLLQDGAVSVECRAMCDFDAGKPVTMFYGKRSNTQLALYSGFIVPGNLYDEVPVAICLPEDVELAPLKARALAKRSLHVQHPSKDGDGVGIVCVVNIGIGSTAVDKAYAVAHVITMDKDEFTAYLRSNDLLPKDIPQRKQLFQLVVDALTRKLSQYQQAQTQLKSHDLQSSPENFIENLHRCEMTLLENAIQSVRMRQLETT